MYHVAYSPDFRLNHVIIANILQYLKMHLPSTSFLKPNIIQAIKKFFCKNSVISISTYYGITQWGSWELLRWLNLFASMLNSSTPNRLLKFLCFVWKIYLLSHSSCQLSLLLMQTAHVCTVLQSLRSTFHILLHFMIASEVPFQFATKVPGFWKQDNQT